MLHSLPLTLFRRLLPIAAVFCAGAVFLLVVTSRAPTAPALPVPLREASAVQSAGKEAYVTLLCNDEFLAVTRVLVQTLMESNATRPLIVMVAPNVSSEARLQLLRLGASEIVQVTPPPYPMTATRKRMELQKPCRFSKLELWSWVGYSRLIFLDSDMLIVKNVDHLFDERGGGPLSAAPDAAPPDRFNSGLMVIEPDLELHRQMIGNLTQLTTYNAGDQGFLNNFFCDWYLWPAVHRLPYKYNLFTRMAEYTFFEEARRSAFILHFSGDSKLFQAHEHERDLSPRYRELKHTWQAAAVRALARVQQQATPERGVIARAATAASQCLSAEKLLQPEQLARQPSRLSVILPSFDRLALLTAAVDRYLESPLVDHIYVYWANPQLKAPTVTELLHYHHCGSENDTTSGTCTVAPSLLSEPRVSVTLTDAPLSERFRLPSATRPLQTRAVLIADDDIGVDDAQLRQLFAVWQQYPEQLVGAFPRSHRSLANGSLTYEMPRGNYSMMLTKLLLLDANYLAHFWCTVPLELLQWVDDNRNCEDILLNFVLADKTHLPPIYVDVRPHDYGTTSGISATTTQHLDWRSGCLTRFAAHWQRNPLRYSSVQAEPFVKAHFIKAVS